MKINAIAIVLFKNDKIHERDKMTSYNTILVGILCEQYVSTFKVRFQGL